MELNGASARDAMLWFLFKERLRHIQDILRINRDIKGLRKLGAVLPDEPSLDTFIEVPGVKYESTS